MSNAADRHRGKAPFLGTLAVFAVLLAVSGLLVGLFVTGGRSASANSGAALTATVAAAQAGTAAQGAPASDPFAAGEVRRPSNALGLSSDPALWRAIRQGGTFSVSIPDKKAAMLVQSEGELWRDIRNGPLFVYGQYALGGIVALLAVFFVLRGRIKIGKGLAGRTVERFNTIERASHWLLASSFIILALTGLNLLYGKHFLRPIIGPEAFTTLVIWGKYAHNFLAFGFMLGIILIFLLWVKDNIPGWTDVKWFVKGGGIIGKGHPDSKRFNGGQKIIFWSVVLGGVSLSLSGIALMWPFQFHFFADTFSHLNTFFGTDLPTQLAPIQEQQLNQLWHSAVSIVMIVIIVAHIYIGSLGMQGAFAAMGSGQVDINWAREHHNLWVAELEKRGKAPSTPPAAPPAATPAE